MEGKDIATGLMSDPLDIREIFFSNLLLLGFDPHAEETNYRILLNRDMFVYSNKKAMEIVCYFLFCRLDPQLAFQEFRDCWRIQDKKMEQQFRKSCISWLSKIYKEEQDANLPRVGPSLFLSPGGDRFYELMFYFSSFVLRRVMAREHGKHGTIPYVCKKTARNPNMTRISSKAIIVKTISEKDRFFKEVQHDLEVQEHWKSYAASNTKEHRKLSKESRELERRLNPKGFVNPPKDKSTFGEEAEAIRRTKQLQKVRELWLKLETFLNDSKEKRTVLHEILQGHEETFCIDGSEIQLQIPEVLTTKYKHYIQMKNIGNTYQAGKLDLLSLIQLCSLALHQLKEKIEQDGIQSFEQFAPFIKNEVHAHAAHLSNAQNLRSSLVNEVIPELKTSIEELKKDCYSHLDERVHSPAVALETFNFGLGLLPTTPSPAFAAAGRPVRSSEIPENSLRKTPHNKDTPDAVESLTTSIREMIVKGNQELDERKFDIKHISERSVEGSDAPKPFFSKIPKPVNRRLSQTPDGLSRRSRAFAKRMTVSTTKKPKKPNKNEIARNVATLNTGSPCYSSQVVATKSATPGAQEFSVERPRDARTKMLPVVTQKDMGEQATPLRTGLKSALKKNPSAARLILAEKIAKAVFADEPTIHTGNSSSQSSSGENTPKDIGVADPVGNLGEEPFISKDLIPRTPFKEDDSYSDVPFLLHVYPTKDEIGNGLEVSEEVNRTRTIEDYPSQLTPFKHDPLPENRAIFSPAGTPALSFLSSGAHDNASANPATPEATQPISISWKTPFATPQGTLSSAYSYTPIESKLTVVDVNTAYAVTPERTKSSNHLAASITRHSLSNPAVLDSIVSARTMVDLPNVNRSRGSLSPTTDNSLLEGGNLRSDIFSVPSPNRTAPEDGISLPDSRPLSIRASNPAHSPMEPSVSEPRPFYTDSMSNIARTESSRTLFNSHTHANVIDKQSTGSFNTHDGSLPTIISHPSKADVAVPTTSSSASIPTVSAPTAVEKPPLNDLFSRYQRLKQAQEVAKSVPEDDEVTSPLLSPMSVTTIRAFATPETRVLGDSGREASFEETPLMDTAPPMDLNANSLGLNDRERVKFRLFSDRTPGLPSLMDTKPFFLDSPPEDTMNISGRPLASEDNIFEAQELNLTPVEIGDWYVDQFRNNLSSFSVGKNLEDEARPMSWTEIEEPE